MNSTFHKRKAKEHYQKEKYWEARIEEEGYKADRKKDWHKKIKNYHLKEAKKWRTRDTHRK